MEYEKLRTFYRRLEKAVNRLTPELMNFPTKIGGWTPGQYLHHLADAQTQAFYRCLWILSEDNTVLKVFNQDSWVALLGHQPTDGAMFQLKGIYLRWTALLDSLQEWQFGIKGMHPELGELTIRDIVNYYIDHGENHIKQFTEFNERE